MNKIKPLYIELLKHKIMKEKKYINPNNKIRTLINLINNPCINEDAFSKDIIANQYKQLNMSNISAIDINEIKSLVNQNILDEIYNQEYIDMYNNYVSTYNNEHSIYNPNKFNIYYSFYKGVNEHFDWCFYKYFYEDTVENNIINSHEDAITHYLMHGYKELRYICLDEYLYDKNDKELEQNIKTLVISDYYAENKKDVDAKKLSKIPIIHYIKYKYENKSISI